MNLAFGALVLLFIFLPGIIFRSTLINSDSLENPLDSNLIGELIWIVIPSTILHLFSVPLLCLCYDIRIDQIYLLIIGSNSSKEIDFNIIAYSWPRFIFYITTLCSLAWTIAHFLKRWVIAKRLDQKYRLAKITNEWDNLLSGRIANESIPIDYVSIDVIMETGGNTYIYTGFLDDYFLSKNNGLDKLFLKNVYRRKLESDKIPEQYDQKGKEEGVTRESDDVSEPVEKEQGQEGVARESDGRYYSMPGDRFIVPFDKVVNLNVSFHYKQPSTE